MTEIVKLTRRACLGLAAVAAGSGHSAAQGTTGVSVAAAADLRQALDEIASRFGQAGGGKVRMTYGSSGNLARQIGQGAPFELFMSADEALTEKLIASGDAEGPGAIYGIGRLVVVARSDSPIEAERGLPGLLEAVAGNRLARFAIANPEHAPYGARAKQALEKSGLWASFRDRLVLAENVAQAAQYVVTGAAGAGITALALVKTGPAAAVLRVGLVPAELHTPLRQRMVLTKRASPAARDFYAFVASADAQVILRTNGFEQQ